MTEDNKKNFGLYRLRYPLAAFEVVLDTRLSTITFAPTGKQNNAPHAEQQARRPFFTLRLDCFTSFEEDLGRLKRRKLKSDVSYADVFRRYLDKLTLSREALPNQLWRDAFGDLAFLLLRYAHKHSGIHLRKARELLIWLGATDPSSAWRLAYNNRLSFEHRYKLMKAFAPDGPGAVDSETKQPGEIDLPEQKERELCWWSARQRYEFAVEWCRAETYRNPAASQALLDETLHYVHVLKNEQRQQDLGRFLAECGTNIEYEVKRVLFPSSRHPQTRLAPTRTRVKRSFWKRLVNRGKKRRRSKLIPSKPTSADSVAKDEVVRRAFFVWFLKRYDWLSAARLVFKGPKKRQLSAKAGIFVLLNFIALLLYVAQLNEPAVSRLFSFMPSTPIRVPLLWASQLLLQLGSLIMLLLIAPVLFRLLMPRALFGSLLAWTTVIFLAMKDVAEFKMSLPSEWKLTSLCHSSSYGDPQIFLTSLFISLGVLALDAVFVGYTVTQFTEGFRRILFRTVSTLGFLLAGSLFWGFAFALPIKVALERDSFAFDCHCVIPIVLIGSSVAVLFGLMVELIWQDQSLAEPIGEPL